MISTNIVKCIRSNRFQQDYVVKASEVYEMIGYLKANKNEGLCGLSSDFFINGPPELSIHIALLITAMLSHGFSPSLLTVSTIIPIPKGNQVNLSESANYRAITLSSILCKIIDLIVINRYGECLNTSVNQFGFKPKGSTSMCTMLVKETISYYRANSNDVYCVFLDASKAFDRVRYDKLFNCLFDRNIPVIFIRLLLNMYTSHFACVLWDGVYTNRFPIQNGVKQGGILSPVLFCIYIDGLLDKLADTHIGCYIGRHFLGALAYADDIVLLAPTPTAMRKLLSVCDEFAKDFHILFNAGKSKCILFPSSHYGGINQSSILPSFFVGDNLIEYVQSWPHLGHILCSDLRDDDD